MGLSENLWTDDLAQVEVGAPLSVPAETPIREAMEAMRRAGTGCVLVCRERALAGIFTERDVIQRVLVVSADLDGPVSACMTADPVTIRRSDPVGLAIRTMCQGGYRRLPVVDEQGAPVGILSAKALVRYLVDHFPLAVYNLPPQSRQTQEAREGA